MNITKEQIDALNAVLKVEITRESYQEKGDKILKDLESLFDSLQIDNAKVIRNIYRKEEIYSGPLMNQAPDLVLIGNEGFNLKSNIKSEKLFSQDIFTGKHTLDDAFLLLKDPQAANNIPENLTISDPVTIFNGG